MAALKAFCILDTEPEPAFDDAVNLAAAICGTPISLITLLDGRRQWFKARAGMAACETPQEYAFCSHAIRGREIFIVKDALTDPRFRDNPLVTGEPFIRFYAGVPLVTAEGHALGTLCVIDTVPRELTAQQKTALTLLARQVFNQMKARNQMRGMKQTLVETSLLQRQMAGNNDLFQTFMDNGPMVAFVKDAEGRLLYYNRLFAERFKITREDWLGKDDFQIWPREFAEKFRATDLSVLKSGSPVVAEEISPGPNGVPSCWRSYKFPFITSSGDRLLAGIALDVSIEKRAEIALKESHERLELANEQLRELSITDALTGIRNRRAFDEYLEQCIAVAGRYGFDLSMLLLDVDDFKSFNDTFGHEEGDEVLRSLSDLLVQEARSTDLVCRYGGEEFAVLLPNTGLDQALLLADRIRHSVATARWRRRAVTVSVGVCALGTCLTEESSFVHQADLALYRAKALGKNRVVPYHAEIALTHEQMR